MADTQPSAKAQNVNTPVVAVEATYKDPKTGALYVHQDLNIQSKPWEDEAHVSPPRGEERFGDVDSWVHFVVNQSGTPDFPPHLTWNARGLKAVLDYHAGIDNPGRCQWTALYPFVRSRQWEAWMALATDSAIPHEDAIEALEDRAEDIVEPPAAEVMNLLRHLKATVNKAVEVNRREDGTAFMSVVGDQTVSARGGVADLPSTIKIGIPVLKGHVDDKGAAVKYGLTVRVRFSASDKGKLALRFSCPDAEATLEDVYANRVKAAKDLLGDAVLLRAAD